jgi:CHAT domain-containing protein/tetratricopeptide (TPR) repeat protein
VRAEEAFTGGKYSQATASARTLRAEILAHMGFAQEAWQPRILSLRALQAAQGSFSFFHNGLIEGATSAERAGSYAVADAFLEEAAEVDRSKADTTSEIEVLLTKARLLRQRGFHAEATRDFRRAANSLPRIAGKPDSKRFEQTIQVGLWADPAYSDGRRDAELSAASRFFAATGAQSLQLLALRVQAARQRQDGEAKAARHTLDEAIAVIRDLQKDFRSDRLKIQQLDSAQDFFDQAIDLALSAQQPLYALELLESVRSESDLQDLRLEPPGRATAPPAAEPVVVVFGLTPETFVWWRVEGNAVRWGSREARSVEAEVRTTLATVPEGRATRAQLSRLYQFVLGDALRDVAPGRPLVLVPDGLLQQVPFSALWNSETGVRLIDERAISLRSSLVAALSRQVDPGNQPPRRDWRVIAVGDPAFDLKRLPWSRLPGAAEEAQKVARIYGEQQALFLKGPDAQAGAVRQALGSSEVLHLSTHASLGADASTDAFVLAASPDGRSSGLVTAAELLPAGTPLRLAVLSGCSTLGVRPSRSGGLLGLGRAFVNRGVPATLGTLWTVGDRSLPDLMADFHRLIRQGSAASEALRQSQRAYLAKHPDSCCDWAALELIGDLPAERSTLH